MEPLDMIFPRPTVRREPLLVHLPRVRQRDALAQQPPDVPAGGAPPPAVPPRVREERGRRALVRLARAAQGPRVPAPGVAPAGLRRQPVHQQVAVDAAQEREVRARGLVAMSVCCGQRCDELRVGRSHASMRSGDDRVPGA